MARNDEAGLRLSLTGFFWGGEFTAWGATTISAVRRDTFVVERAKPNKLRQQRHRKN